MITLATGSLSFSFCLSRKLLPHFCSWHLRRSISLKVTISDSRASALLGALIIVRISRWNWTTPEKLALRLLHRFLSRDAWNFRGISCQIYTIPGNEKNCGRTATCPAPHPGSKFKEIVSFLCTLIHVKVCVDLPRYKLRKRNYARTNLKLQSEKKLRISPRHGFPFDSPRDEYLKERFDVIREVLQEKHS